jgi:hypothetical protein
VNKGSGSRLVDGPDEVLATLVLVVEGEEVPCERYDVVVARKHRFWRKHEGVACRVIIVYSILLCRRDLARERWSVVL